MRTHHHLTRDSYIWGSTDLSVFSNSLVFFSSVSDFNVTKFCKRLSVFVFIASLRMTLIVSYQLWPILARSWVVRKKDWFVPWKLHGAWGCGLLGGGRMFLLVIRRKHAPADNYKLLVYLFPLFTGCFSFIQIHPRWCSVSMHLMTSQATHHSWRFHCRNIVFKYSSLLYFSTIFNRG